MGREDTLSTATLHAGALGLLDAIVMGVAGSAPAYSVAATTAVLVATVGLAGPAALLYAGLPMFGIAWAFLHMGRVEPSAGATYRWAARALDPALGYVAAWALVVSATLFMVAGSLPAGAVTVGLVSPAAADNVVLVTAVGAAWFLVMAAMVLVGVRLTAKVQWLMSGVEVAILLLVVVLAAIRGPAPGAPAFSWAWFGPGALRTPAVGAGGVVLAAFYYWGWDVTANLAEETAAPRRNPGAAGAVGLGVVLVLFVAFAVVTNIRLSPAAVARGSGDVLLVLGRSLWPGPGGPLLVLAVLLSTVATLETTLIQVTRTLFAMARDHVMPRALGRVHPRYRTPWLATAAVALVALLLFLLSSVAGSVSAALDDAISAIGLQVVVYYALAGIAAVVWHRRVLVSSVGNFLLLGLWPALGALFMLACGVYEATSLSAVGLATGIGLLAVGLVPLLIYRRRGAAFFRSDAS